MAVILFEPVYVIPPLVDKDERISRSALNVRGVKMRKDRFPSREDAAKWARKRMPWKTWDERMFNCYMVGLLFRRNSHLIVAEIWL